MTEVRGRARLAKARGTDPWFAESQRSKSPVEAVCENDSLQDVFLSCEVFLLPGFGRHSAGGNEASRVFDVQTPSLTREEARLDQDPQMIAILPDLERAHGRRLRGSPETLVVVPWHPPCTDDGPSYWVVGAPG